VRSAVTKESSAHRRAIDLEAEALLARHDFDGAARVYAGCLTKNPGDQGAKAGVELVEGLRALHTGDRMEAAQRLELALDLDPSNALAASKLAEMRRQATTERRGALTKLLQRKGEP
jgi:thioredoxin-like negative regulator of GroEL